MDGSLVNHDAALLEDLNKICHPSEKIMDLWGDEEKLSYMRNRINLIRSQPGWWFKLKPIQIAVDLFKIAQSMGFTCEVLTKGPKHLPNAWKEKIEWCQQNLSMYVNVHIVSDNTRYNKFGGKGRVYGRVLYDDYPEYMDKWLLHRPRGLGIMPVTPYNKNYEHPNVLKYNGDEKSTAIVKEALKRVLVRKDTEPLNIQDLREQS